MDPPSSSQPPNPSGQEPVDGMAKEEANPDELVVPVKKPELASAPQVIAVVASLYAPHAPSSVSTDKISFIEVKTTHKIVNKTCGSCLSRTCRFRCAPALPPSLAAPPCAYPYLGVSQPHPSPPPLPALQLASLFRSVLGSIYGFFLNFIYFVFKAFFETIVAIIDRWAYRISVLGLALHSTMFIERYGTVITTKFMTTPAPAPALVLASEPPHLCPCLCPRPLRRSPRRRAAPVPPPPPPHSQTQTTLQSPGDAIGGFTMPL